MKTIGSDLLKLVCYRCEITSWMFVHLRTNRIGVWVFVAVWMFMCERGQLWDWSLHQLTLIRPVVCVCVYVCACVRLRFRALVGSLVPCLILVDLWRLRMKLPFLPISHCQYHNTTNTPQTQTHAKEHLADTRSLSSFLFSMRIFSLTVIVVCSCPCEYSCDW